MHTSRKYSVLKIPPLTAKEAAEIKRRPVDYSDIPQVTKEEFDAGHFVYADFLKLPKKDVHTKIDMDVFEWLAGTAPKGYQKRLNAALRWAMMQGFPVDKMA